MDEMRIAQRFSGAGSAARKTSPGTKERSASSPDKSLIELDPVAFKKPPVLLLEADVLVMLSLVLDIGSRCREE